MISFPNLHLTFNISPIAFNLLGRDVYWYGIIIAFAIISGSVLALQRAKNAGLNGDLVVDAILWAVAAALIGARTYFVLFNWREYTYFPDVFKIWNGGIAIYGGVIGGVVALFIFCKRKNLNFFELADVLVPALLLGQAIGRWGNFVNREAFGSETMSFLRMEIDGMSVHPTFLYESVWNFIGIFAVIWIAKKLTPKGSAFWAYIAWYGLGRFFIEGLRTDSLPYGATWKISQIVAGLSFLVAFYMLARYATSRRTTSPDSKPCPR